MKIKRLFPIVLLLLVISLATKAADFNCINNHLSIYAKIAAIDDELNQAKSLDEIETVSVKIYELISKKINDTCPAPESNAYKALCADIGSKAKVATSDQEYYEYEYTYEKRILQIACVNVKIDNEETIKKKVQLFWNKYKKNCKCDSVDFGVQNGNILKFALSQNMPEVIETLVYYGCDINFIDPADGLNLLDYVISVIDRLRKLINSEGTLKVFEGYKAGIIGLGGKSNQK